jgi:asparagine synthase (glutamine-hydrolysing)
MCGIAGFWNLRTGRPADPSAIRAATRSLIHRGPDEEGYLVDGALALGSRRLTVVDPRGGRQPMGNEDGSVHVVFNGEIYNHGELRVELQGAGHRFRTRSDTEVLVHAWEEWGPDGLERLNGMFALAVWDARRRCLLLGRDRLGIKPLYVWDGPEGMAFGSELKAVVALPWVPLEWDLEAVDDFMTYEYVPAPGCILRNARKLRPGHWLLYREGDGGAGRLRRYWAMQGKEDPPRAPSPGSPAGDGSRRKGASRQGPRIDPREAAFELRERLRTAVRRRLMADVPLGAFLSGGIDSSAVVALMAGELGEGVRTFSLGFRDASYDERHHARAVAEDFGTHHREGLVEPEVVELAERLAGHFDEPFADVSAFPTFQLSRLARKDVTVVLSGDGGDELLAGYDHYRADRWARRLGRVLRTGGWEAAEAVLDRLPPSPRKKGPVNLAKRFVEGARRPADLEHARWWVFQDLAQRRALYAPELAEALGGRDCFGAYRERLREGAERGFDGLNRQLYADLTGYLPDDILAKVDRMSMAVSLEARVPFLDHELVEHVVGLPGEWKLRGRTTKWLLKEAMRGVLPPAVLGRGKEGFSIPLKNWLRGPLEPFMRDLLDEGRLRERGWFAPAEVRRLVEEHVQGRENHAHRLWCLMSLELSMRSLAVRVVTPSGRP